jgi:hypothetical protein
MDNSIKYTIAWRVRFLYIFEIVFEKILYKIQDLKCNIQMKHVHKIDEKERRKVIAKILFLSELK